MNSATHSIAKFPLGRIVVTSNALKYLTLNEIACGIIRHQSGDWGELNSDDRLENDLALEWGYRLFSQYDYENSFVFWVITEADRSVTTVMMPNDI